MCERRVSRMKDVLDRNATHANRLCSECKHYEGKIVGPVVHEDGEQRAELGDREEAQVNPQ
jgi:hypothetical protein